MNKKIEIKEWNRIRCLRQTGLIRNKYEGSSMHTHISQNYQQQTVDVLYKIGLRTPKDFICGNDAPRKGWSGLYVKLTEEGKRFFTNLEQQIMKVYPTISKKQLDEKLKQLLNSLIKLS
jgi:hypothetical protein